jgi:hypothetical protein
MKNKSSLNTQDTQIERVDFAYNELELPPKSIYLEGFLRKNEKINFLYNLILQGIITKKEEILSILNSKLEEQGLGKTNARYIGEMLRDLNNLIGTSDTDELINHLRPSQDSESDKPFIIDNSHFHGISIDDERLLNKIISELEKDGAIPRDIFVRHKDNLQDLRARANQSGGSIYFRNDNLIKEYRRFLKQKEINSNLGNLREDFENQKIKKKMVIQAIGKLNGVKQMEGFVNQVFYDILESGSEIDISVEQVEEIIKDLCKKLNTGIKNLKDTLIKKNT